MKKSRYTETQIIQILKQGEAGVSTAELCREHGISSATYHNWKAKYGGIDTSGVKRLRDLEEENRRPHDALRGLTPAGFHLAAGFALHF